VLLSQRPGEGHPSGGAVLVLTGQTGHGMERRQGTRSEKDVQVVKPELGTKRSCPSCQTRFYDLGRDPIVCPKCGVSFVPEQLLPSKADQAVTKPRVVAEPEVELKPEAEIVDVKAVEGADDSDDETAGVEGVELDEDTELADDDTFLEEVEDDEEEVTDLIGGTPEDEEP
jgi:uncharacterized protein (TIGR02300 family)